MLRFCVGKKAKKPYYMKELHIRIYSMEELCFYLCENVGLLDKGLLSEELVGWIDIQCGMDRLGKELYEILHFDGSVHCFVSAILSAVGYRSPEEIRLLEKRIKTYEQMDGISRKKAQADHLFLSGRYALAMERYTLLLQQIRNQMEQKENVPEEMYRSVLHNLATTCARLFFFEAAADLYSQAYEAGGGETELKHMIMSRFYAMGETKFEAYKQSMPEHKALFEESERFVKQCRMQWKALPEKEEFENARVLKELGKRDEYLAMMNRKMDEWKKKYHFCVMS